MTPPSGDDELSSDDLPVEGNDLPKPGDHSTWAVSLPDPVDEPAEPTAAFEPDPEPEPFVPPPQPPLEPTEPQIAEPLTADPSAGDPRPPPPGSAPPPDPTEFTAPVDYGQPTDYGQPAEYGQPSVYGPTPTGYGPAPGFEGSTPAYYPTPAIDSQAQLATVLGVIALPFIVCCAPIGIVLGATALILGIISLNRINDSQGMLTGREWATAGAILGGIALVGTLALNLLPIGVSFLLFVFVV